MSAKRAAAKSTMSSVSKKKIAKTASKGARRPLAKPSAKKTVKSAKSTSQKKVSKSKPAAHKAQAPKGPRKIAGRNGHNAPISAKRTLLPRPLAARVSLRPPASARRRSSGSLLSGPVRGFTPYQPRRGEDYMSKGQLEHFRQILLAWKRELMEEVDRTMLHMKDDAANFPDPNDRATQESEFGLELRTRDRERKLLKKIDSALSRIDDGSYGYCEETGDEIGLRRLEARPVATLCVEAQERRELAERQFRDREDQYR